jgi:GNAT superfamily N-acetyltransferase
MNASLAADGNGERVTPDELANLYAHPLHWDPQEDTLIAAVAQSMIGYAITERREEDAGALVHWVNLHLPAPWRGCGLELAMQRYMERRARAAAAATPGGLPGTLASMVPETWRARVEMLLAEGYAPARYFFEMQRSLDGDLPPVSLPPGLEFRTPLPAHYRTIWDADVECDRDNWGHLVPGDEVYRAWVETPGLDPTLWRVVWDGAQVAGAAINVLHEGSWGETDDLFVRRPWRKLGLGRALLLASMHGFKARGLTTAGLGVDADNPSGALRLYQGLGYSPYQRMAVYRKPL